MHTAIRTWPRGLAKRIGETLGEKDWREAWQRGLARHLAKRIGEEEEEEKKQTALIKFSNPHLAGGEKSLRKSEEEDAGARKSRKVAQRGVFPMICGSKNPKVGLLKWRVRSQLARPKTKNCMPLWRGARSQVKSVQD